MPREFEPAGCSQCERCMHQTRRYRDDSGLIVYLRCGHPDLIATTRIEEIQAQRLQRDCLEDATRQRCMLFCQFESFDGAFIAEDIIPPVTGSRVPDGFLKTDSAPCEAHALLVPDPVAPAVFAPRL